MLVSNLAVTSKKKEELTESDPNLQIVYYCCENESHSIKVLEDSIKLYYSISHELH